MAEEDHKDFMSAQIKEIEVYKWLESEKAHRDLGEDAVKEWIKKYAKEFREKWQKMSKNDTNQQ